jgi:hypothetical protein
MNCHSASVLSLVYRIPILLGEAVKKVQQNLHIYWAFLTFQTGS